MRLEKNFSTKFRNHLKQIPGVYGFRIESPGTLAGIPDWCLLIKPGRVVFVELKVKAKLSTAQVAVHSLMRSYGVEVLTLRQNENNVTINDSKGYETLTEAIRAIVEKRYD